MTSINFHKTNHTNKDQFKLDKRYLQHRTHNFFEFPVDNWFANGKHYSRGTQFMWFLMRRGHWLCINKVVQFEIFENCAFRKCILCIRGWHIARWQIVIERRNAAVTLNCLQRPHWQPQIKSYYHNVQCLCSVFVKIVNFTLNEMSVFFEWNFNLCPWKLTICS